MTEKLTRRLYTQDFSAPETERELLSEIRNLAEAFVCLSAFYIAIPGLDLVLTPTGFGVVRNQNVAPASKERVEALRRSIHEAENNTLDRLIDKLRTVVDWTQSSYGSYFFSSLFWRGDQMLVFGITSPTRDDLAANQRAILEAGAKLSRIISPELYSRLIELESKDAVSHKQQLLIGKCRVATAAICNNSPAWPDIRLDILSFIEGNLEEFPEYHQSGTYKANHIERYENKKDDSCFFFG